MIIQKLIVTAAVLLTVSTTPDITAGTGTTGELKLCTLRLSHVENSVKVCAYV